MHLAIDYLKLFSFNFFFISKHLFMAPCQYSFQTSIKTIKLLSAVDLVKLSAEIWQVNTGPVTFSAHWINILIAIGTVCRMNKMHLVNLKGSRWYCLPRLESNSPNNLPNPLRVASNMQWIFIYCLIGDEICLRHKYWVSNNDRMTVGILLRADFGILQQLDLSWVLE